eukprot:TRINITY_DN19492_c0_g1_i1.p1 TRINITY_DN19492_c0_g1~~TRINITY_DN19492_c0_g1_i1.p1  ORF type:complete len:963 (-),score=134.69 TRINITY_DN19492_c0_g1_i1:211-3099(-)
MCSPSASSSTHGRIPLLVYSRRYRAFNDASKRAIAAVLRSAMGSEVSPTRGGAGECGGSRGGSRGNGPPPPTLLVPAEVPHVQFIGGERRDVFDTMDNAEVGESAKQHSPASQDARPDGTSAGMASPTIARSVGGRLAASGAARHLLSFSAAFECGNLFSAKLLNFDGVASDNAAPPGLPQAEYELEMERDTRSTQTQWFYFACSNSRPCNVTFRIVNFRKKRSLYSLGMQPHVCSIGGSDGGTPVWDAAACYDVQYLPNGRVTPAGKMLYTLSFRYEFRAARSVVLFAAHTPYTFTMLRTFLSRLVRHPTTAPNVSETILCRSLAGVQVPLLLITGGLPPSTTGPLLDDRDRVAKERSLAGARKKPAVVIIARQHPGEVVGSYVVAGLIRFLVGPSPEAAALRENFCFHVVPMVNVDGVIFGNSRCTLAGVDPNRMWQCPDAEGHPEIYALREYLEKAQQRSTVSMFLDLHGHSQRTGAFFYGCCPEQLRSAVFPKLVSLTTRDVDFNGCRWRFGRGHNRTARVVAFSRHGVFNSFTMETSLFAQKALTSCRGVNAESPPSPSAVGEGGVVSAMNSVDVVSPSSLKWVSPEKLQEVLFVPSRAESIGCAVGKAMFRFFEVEAPSSGQALPILPATPRPQAYVHHFEVFDGSEGQHLPWLTYTTLRSASVSDVLGKLEACAMNCFDLRLGEGPASDSDGDDAVIGDAFGEEVLTPTSEVAATAHTLKRNSLRKLPAVRSSGLGGLGLSLSSPDHQRLLSLRQVELPKASVRAVDESRKASSVRPEASSSGTAGASNAAGVRVRASVSSGPAALYLLKPMEADVVCPGRSLTVPHASAIAAVCTNVGRSVRIVADGSAIDASSDGSAKAQGSCTGPSTETSPFVVSRRLRSGDRDLQRSISTGAIDKGISLCRRSPSHAVTLTLRRPSVLEVSGDCEAGGGEGPSLQISNPCWTTTSPSGRRR